VTNRGTIPHDPENQNDYRAKWAQATIDAFIVETHTDECDALPDLLCDLMHWADRQGTSFDYMVERARRNYAEETMPDPAEEEDRLNWESAGRIIDEEARQLKRIKAETSTFPPFPHQSKYDRECSTPTPADRGTARKKGRQ
jgi:hypothetical protein